MGVLENRSSKTHMKNGRSAVQLFRGNFQTDRSLVRNLRKETGSPDPFFTVVLSQGCLASGGPRTWGGRSERENGNEKGCDEPVFIGVFQYEGWNHLLGILLLKKKGCPLWFLREYKHSRPFEKPVERDRMLCYGTCHPKGEGEEFDGLFLKKTEMDHVAEGLRGKPMYYEHDDVRVGQVGRIHHAWKTDDSKLNILFETDPTCFEGTFASRLVRHGLCRELSLGHRCKINFSKEELRVGEKIPVEVSIVSKGDRPDTLIHGWTMMSKQDPSKISVEKEYKRERKRTRYTETMGDTTETTLTESPSEASSTPSPEMQELLKQLQSQTEQNAVLQREHTDAVKKVGDLGKELEDYKSVGKKRRQEALDGAVKDWVTQMIGTHNKELGPYESKLTEILSAMKNHEDATPLVQMLSCAATASASSTSKLNKAYQDLKESQATNKRLRTRVEESSKPAFASETERFSAPSPPEAPSDAYSSMFTNSVSSSQRYGKGMAQTNPGLYTAIRRSAAGMTSGTAMRPNIDLSLYSKPRQMGWMSSR